MEEEKMLNTELDEEIEVEGEEVDNPNESKSEKFIRVAERRMTKLLDWIRRIDYLSNRNSYEYTDEQVEQMFTAIEDELKAVKSHFLKNGKAEKKFRFK